MVKLYPVMSVGAADKSKVESVSKIDFRQKKIPNRFNGNMYDRSVDFSDDCCLADNCKCYHCNEAPLIVISSEDGEPTIKEQEITKRNVKEYINSGLFEPVLEESFFIYSHFDLNGKEQLGILAAIDVEDCKQNIVKCHEKVLPHCDSTLQSIAKSAIDPVLLMYRESFEINQIVTRISTTKTPIRTHAVCPGYSEEHNSRIWAIEDPKDMELLRAAFESTVDSLYIADGHHRTAAACRLWDLANGGSGDSAKRSPKSGKYIQAPVSTRKKFISALMFPHNQLTVLPYNRCVKSLNGLSTDSFLEEVSSRFLVTPCSRDADSLTSGESQSTDGSQQSGQSDSDVEEGEEEELDIRMYIDGSWYNLSDPSTTSTHCTGVITRCPLSVIAAQVLADKLFVPVLQTHLVGNTENIIYVDGREGDSALMRLVDSNQAVAAFSLPTVTVKQIMAVADAGLLLPPKATFFSPKPRMGVMLRLQG